MNETTAEVATRRKASTLDQLLIPMVEEEVSLSEKAHGVSLSDIERHTQRTMAIVDARVQALQKIRAAAIVSTEPENWTMFGDFGSLSAGGCYALIDLYGIRIFNLRDAEGRPVNEPIITEEADGTLSAYIIGDAESSFTGKKIEGIRAERNTGEKFTGRSAAIGANPATVRNDLKSSTRTLLDSKAIRIMTFTSKVPKAVLAQYLDVSRLTLGSGHGTGDERRAGATMTEEAKGSLEDFRKAVVGYCGGVQSDALSLMQGLAAFKNDKGEEVKPKSWEALGQSPKWFGKTRKAFEDRLKKEAGDGK